MKYPIIIYISLMLLLLSCKSQKDVSRTSTNQSRGESLVTVVDTTQTHLETSHNIDGTQQEDKVEYSKTTEYDHSGGVTKMIETLNFINLKVDFKSQLDQIKREDFRYNATVTISDTASTVVTEQGKEKTDSRPVQGWEWLAIVIGIAIAFVIVVIILIR